MVLFPKDLFHTEWLILTHQCKELDEEGLSMRIFSFSLRTEVNRWTANVVLMELQASFPETLRERIHRAAVSIPHFSNLSTWTIFRPFFFFCLFFFTAYCTFSLIQAQRFDILQTHSFVVSNRGVRVLYHYVVTMLHVLIYLLLKCFVFSLFSNDSVLGSSVRNGFSCPEAEGDLHWFWSGVSIAQSCFDIAESGWIRPNKSLLCVYICYRWLDYTSYKSCSTKIKFQEVLTPLTETSHQHVNSLNIRLIKINRQSGLHKVV